MNDEQVLHAMSIDDMYHVDRVLAHSPMGTTEQVSIDGAGPFVRKKMRASLTSRRAWLVLTECACPRLPHIAATYELPDEFVVVYDYMPGQTLANLVRERGRLSQEEAARIARQVCEAAGVLHVHGVIHRDLTPANIIIAADGAHVIDLGIARLRSAGVPHDTTALGTYGYASPEQYGFAQTDASSDLYTIGCLLGFMLTGVSPEVEGYEEALVDTALVSTEARAVISRACAFEPSARYQTAFEMVDALVLLGAGPAEGLIEAEQNLVGATRVSHNTQGEDKTSYRFQNTTDKASAIRFHKGTLVLAVLGVMLTALIVIAGVVLLHGVNRSGTAEPEDPSSSSEADFVAHDEDVKASSGEAESPVTSTLDTHAQVERNDLSSSEDSDTGLFTQLAADTTGVHAAEADEGILEIGEHTWYYDDLGMVNVVFQLINTSAEQRVTYPFLSIAGYSASGSAIFAVDYTTAVVPAGQSVWCALSYPASAEPASVDIKLPAASELTLRPAAESATFAVDEITVTDDGPRVAFVGTYSCLKLPSGASKPSMVQICLVLRNDAGEVVGGIGQTLNSVPDEGSSEAFEIGKTALMLPSDYSTVEAYVTAA